MGRLQDHFVLGAKIDAPPDTENKSEEKRAESTPQASDRKKDAIEHVKMKKKSKLKGAMKVLNRSVEEEKLSREECVEIIEAFKTWIQDEIALEEGDDFIMVAKAFYNWIERVHVTTKTMISKFAGTVISLIHPDYMADLNKE